MTTLDLLTAVLLGTIAVGATAAFLAWRERHEPGAKPLLAMLLGQVWWSAFLVFQLNAATLEAKAQWVDLSWIGVVVIPVAWLLFALEYTGRDRFVRPRYVALLSVVPVITVVLTLTGDYHQLMYLDSRLVEHAGREYIVRSGGPWFWVVAVYTYVLGILGAIPLLGLITSDAVPFRGQSIAILIGLVTPWGINLAHIAGVSPIPGVDPTPIGFAISGVAYLGAVMRFRLFGTNPAPTFNARRLVFDQMQDAAVVVDSHDFVVHMNESAVEAFGQEPREVLGNEAWKTIPQYHTLPEAGSPSGYLTIQGAAGEREYDVTVTRITDAYGRLTGRLITFHDIGEFLRQQQRLEVLNRVLRHNIRTETNIIYGYADFVGEDDSDEMADLIKERAMRIEEMGEKARRISDVFQRENEPAEPVPLNDLIGAGIAAARRRFPGVTIEAEPGDPDVYVSSVLDLVISNLLENAAEHNTNAHPRVRIHTHLEGDEVNIVVEDNGPGIDEYERAVLERGSETPLEHGSGLGLWLVKWGTGIAGGRVAFEENSPTGAVVTVRVPRLSPDGDSPDADAIRPDTAREPSVETGPVPIQDGSGSPGDDPPR